RRKLQTEYNTVHGITPETIRKAIRKGIEEEIQARRVERESVGITAESQFVTLEFIRELESEMLAAAEQLDFERAAQLRDRIHELKKKMGEPVPDEDDSDRPGFASKGRRMGKKAAKKRR
ncbi:MAG: UvrB/UvrC motif-containing protein, partial [Planctomycetota bacterium]